MQRPELAAGRGQSPLDETDLKNMSVNKAADRIGTHHSPASLDHTYGNVPESVIYDEVNDTAAGVGAASDKAEVSKADARIGNQSSPAPLDHTYDNVPEPVIYEEVI